MYGFPQYLHHPTWEDYLPMRNSGPPPKPPEQRRRRNATVPMVQLPAGGRQGDPPPFPLPKVSSKELAALELEIWAELWQTPQAVAWERHRWTRDVAQYARLKAAGELGSMKAVSEARQMGDRLGLNPHALLRLRWEIAPDELDEVRTARPTSKRRASLRIADTGS